MHFKTSFKLALKCFACSSSISHKEETKDTINTKFLFVGRFCIRNILCVKPMLLIVHGLFTLISFE